MKTCTCFCSHLECKPLQRLFFGAKNEICKEKSNTLYRQVLRSLIERNIIYMLSLNSSAVGLSLIYVLIAGPFLLVRPTCFAIFKIWSQ